MPETGVPGRPALLVTRNFPPLLGGMENVNLRLLQSLARRGPVLLCGPKGSAAFAAGAGEVREVPLRPLWRFVLGSAWSAFRMARRHRPALVMAGSGLAAPMAWLAARASGAKLAVYLHGLDLIVANRTYQRLWLPFIRACDQVLVNSRHTAGLAQGKGIEASRIGVLNPGTEVPALDPGASAAFRARHGLGERPLLLSVGRLTRRKGLVEFVSRALPRVVARHPQVLLAVIGEEASDALHTAAGSERERIEAAAHAAGVAAQLRFLGRCSGEELAQAYQAAQLHVFPVLEQPGDVEGFGMVALESAAHGLRTVAFAVGGVPDAIEPGSSGMLVPSGDYAGFAEATNAMLDQGPSPQAVAAGRAFASGKDWQAFEKRLHELLGSADERR
jgi:phosphatidylinositol alpha-1,6-mannosyltransferase